MRLATFLETAQAPILDAAVEFARTIPTLNEMEERVLRDHLPELLQVISADLRTPQSRTESITRSHGGAPASSSQTSAQTHGLMRARAGLTIEQLVAEYRALRSSVLRLWSEAHPPGPEVVQDIMRFNEAIDQAVAESVKFYAQERERWRNIFLGALGHDLRGPLHMLSMTVDAMGMGAGNPQANTALLQRGIKRLTLLLDSLLEYSQTSFGVGMTLQRVPADLAVECADELDLLRAGHPGAHIDYEPLGNTKGAFDVTKVREALTNLVSNAIAHGDPSEPTVVRVEGHDELVRISVENAGQIPAEEIGLLFEPLYQRSTPSVHKARSHLGLGLFIVRQIAKAHGGDAKGTSTESHVCFSIDLPKQTG